MRTGYDRRGSAFVRVAFAAVIPVLLIFRNGGAVMFSVSRTLLSPLSLSCALLCFSLPSGALRAGPKAETYWQVDDLKVGQKGHGLTVMKGTKVERFEAEIIGVM